MIISLTIIIVQLIDHVGQYLMNDNNQFHHNNNNHHLNRDDKRYKDIFLIINEIQ